jgi:hypothetical protein
MEPKSKFLRAQLSCKPASLRARRQKMPDDRTDLMLEILKAIQTDVSSIKHELSSQSLRIAALEDHFRGTLSTLYGIQADVARLKDRVDHIERRMGLKDTEH